MTSLRSSARAFWGSASSIAIGEVVALALLQFLTYAVLIRSTDTETVGLWVLINALLVFSRSADVWSQGLSSFVAQARGQGDTERAASFAVTAMVAGLIGFAVLGVLAYGVIYAAAGRIFGPEQADIARAALPLMVLSFWLLSMIVVLSLAFLGFERPGIKACFTIGGALLFLVFAALFAPQHGLWGLLAAQAVQAALTLAGAAAVTVKLIVLPHRGRFQPALLREILSYSLKAVGVGLFQRAIEPVIRLIVNAFGGLAAVAVVELASRLVQTLRGLVVSLGQILVPTFARLGSDTASTGTADLLRRTEAQFTVMGIAGFAGLLAAGPLLSTLILGGRDPVFLAMLWTLSAGWLCSLLIAPSYFLFQGLRNLRPLYINHAVMTLGAIGLGWLLGTLSGLIGAMVGIALALGLSSLLIWQAAAPYRAQAKRPGPRPWASLLIPPVAAALATLGIYLIPVQTALAQVAVESAAALATFAATVLVFPIRDVLSGLAQSQAGSAR